MPIPLPPKPKHMVEENFEKEIWDINFISDLLRDIDHDRYKGLTLKSEEYSKPSLGRGIMPTKKQVKPTKVHFSNKTTVVIWSDGTKTISKCSEEDTFNKLTGFLVCYYKKINGISNNELGKFIDLLESGDNIKLN